MRYVRIETGFDSREERSGNDRVIAGQLLISEAANDVNVDGGNDDDDDASAEASRCKSFVVVAKFNAASGRLEYLPPEDAKSGKTKCLRVQIFKGQSDWVMVRLIQIETRKTK